MRAIVPWMAMAWALLLAPATALGESSDGNRLPLTSLEAFEGSPEAWTVVSRVYADRPGGDLEVEPGKGVLLFEGAEPATLRSRAQHGDVRLEAEFMMGPGASAALLLQDRYELRLTADQPGYPPGRRDHGAIVYGESQGVPSRLDASRVAGVWQRLVVEFEAPRFDEDGGKRDNARLKRVVLNGTTIHRAVEAPRPSPNAERAEEAKTGPIALRGVEGRIAFRKIRYAPLPADQSGPRSVAGASGGREVGDPPMLLAPVERPVIQRGYVDHREGMRIDGAFVGDPARVHYCIDLAQGALLHAWRGPFLDMAPVWTGRGMDADRVVDRPRIRGSRITFSGRPTAALLPDAEAPWPRRQDAYKLERYTLDEAGRPTFHYRLDGVRLRERIQPIEEARGLTRKITVGGANGRTVWLLLGEGERIEPRAAGYYSIDDERFIRVDAEESPVVRRLDDRDELIVPVRSRSGETAVRADIFW